eukprot:COSAG01_NODE_15082_length_1376_cov_37.385278_2_plen_90_part_00
MDSQLDPTNEWYFKDDVRWCPRCVVRVKDLSLGDMGLQMAEGAPTATSDEEPPCEGDRLYRVHTRSTPRWRNLPPYQPMGGPTGMASRR